MSLGVQFYKKGQIMIYNSIYRIVTIIILITIMHTTLPCPHIDCQPIVTITSNQQHQDLLHHMQGPVAIYYFMNNCTYCESITILFNQLSIDDQFDDITFYSVNGPEINAQQDLQAIYNLQGYPTVLFFNKGNLIDVQLGQTDRTTINKKLIKLLS